MRSYILLAATAILLGGAATAYPQNPKEMEDDSRISLSGIAVSASPDSFKLDYGEGLIKVEMEGSTWYPQQYKKLEGDKVTVYGSIDDDWLQSAEIEASSVYVPSLNTYFYTGERSENFWDFNPTTDFSYDNFTVTGTVSSIDGDEFTVDRGQRQITVNTDELSYNPFDEAGYQRIEVGDRVKVGGDFDDGLFQDREFDADWVVTLERQDGEETTSSRSTY